MTADMNIPGRKMPAYDELPAISRGRYRTWAAEQARQPRTGGAA